MSKIVALTLNVVVSTRDGSGEIEDSVAITSAERVIADVINPAAEYEFDHYHHGVPENVRVTPDGSACEVTLRGRVGESDAVAAILSLLRTTKNDLEVGTTAFDDDELEAHAYAYRNALELLGVKVPERDDE